MPPWGSASSRPMLQKSREAKQYHTGQQQATALCHISKHSTYIATLLSCSVNGILCRLPLPTCSLPPCPCRAQSAQSPEGCTHLPRPVQPSLGKRIGGWVSGGEAWRAASTEAASSEEKGGSPPSAGRLKVQTATHHKGHPHCQRNHVQHLRQSAQLLADGRLASALRLARGRRLAGCFAGCCRLARRCCRRVTHFCCSCASRCCCLARHLAALGRLRCRLQNTATAVILKI